MNTTNETVKTLEERLLAQATLTKESDDRLNEIMPDENRLLGEAYYRLAKVYYDKADFVNSDKLL
jgi:hypothetical protein